MISSHPYNPKAQGKIERSHRELRNKLHYDMVKLKNKVVNWVENLPNYMRVLNELAREELAWQSPFEVYYGRKSNFVVKASYNTNKTITWMPTSSEPTSINVLQNRSKRIKKIRSEAAENTKRLNKRMVDKHKKMAQNNGVQIQRWSINLNRKWWYEVSPPKKICGGGNHSHEWETFW